MASDGEASCVCDPNFAIICSFLEKFAKTCGITHPNFLELQEMLENTQEVAQPLIELHLKLLRKARKSVLSERWEKALIKFCHTYSKPDGWELERFGYKKVPLSLKLRLLKGLLEVQFDANSKFKADVNRLSSEELRLQPIGRDKLGHTYWSQLDEDCNLRVYREDLDDESWEIVARDREGLFKLIGQLSSNEPFNSELDALLNEDSNSQEIENPITDTGQVSKSPNSDEDVDDEGEFEEIETGDEDDFDETDDEKEATKAAPSNGINSEDKVKEELEKVSDKESSDDITVARGTENQPAKIQGDESSGGVDLVGSVKRETESAEIAQDLSQPKGENKTYENVLDSHEQAPENAQHGDLGFATDLSVKKSSVKDMKREHDSDSLDVESATKKKRVEDLGAVIEEPVMLVRGDGSGKDCNTGNSEDIFYKQDSMDDVDFGQAIEEPVMRIWGCGSGEDCDTGNPGKSSDAANDSKEKNDVGQKVEPQKADHSGEGETSSRDSRANLQEKLNVDESTTLVNSKTALSDNELFQESMFKDSLNVKLKKGNLGETSSSTEPASGPMQTNEKTPSIEGKPVTVESPPNGDKAKVTEAPLPVTKRFLHSSTNASQSASFGSSLPQDNTTPVTKSPPKLWTIENICAKPCEAVSPQTSLISCNMEEADGGEQRGKPPLGVQVLSKSPSPSKRVSRWDVGRPSDDEGKCSVGDSSNVRDLQPVPTLATGNPIASEIHEKVQASEVVGDKIIPDGTPATTSEEKKEKKSQERNSDISVEEKNAGRKDVVEAAADDDDDEHDTGFFFGPGCLKFSKPVLPIKKDSKVVEVVKDSLPPVAVNTLVGSVVEKSGSSVTAPAKISPSEIEARGSELDKASKVDEKIPPQILPSSDKVGETISLGQPVVDKKFETELRFGDAEKLTKSPTSNLSKVPGNVLLEEANKTERAPIASFVAGHLNKTESTERSIFSTTSKQSVEVKPLSEKEATGSFVKKSPGSLEKGEDVKKQVSDVEKTAAKVIPDVKTTSAISDVAEKSVKVENKPSLDNKLESSKVKSAELQTGDRSEVKTSPTSEKSTIHSPVKATPKQTEVVKGDGIGVAKENLINLLDPCKVADQYLAAVQKSSSCEVKSKGEEKSSEPVSKCDKKQTFLAEDCQKVTEAVPEVTGTPDKKSLSPKSEATLKKANELSKIKPSESSDEITRSSSQVSTLSSKPPTVQKESQLLSTASHNSPQEEKKVSPVSTNTRLEKVDAISPAAKPLETETAVKYSEVESKISPPKSNTLPVSLEKNIDPLVATANKKASLDFDSPSKQSPLSKVTREKNAPTSKPSTKDEPSVDSSSAVKMTANKSIASDASKLKITSPELKPTPDILEKSSVNRPIECTTTLQDAGGSIEISEKTSSTKHADSKGSELAAARTSLEKNQSLSALATSDKPETISETLKNRGLAPSIKSPLKEVESKKDLSKAPTVTEPLGKDVSKKDLSRKDQEDLGADSTRIGNPQEGLHKTQSSEKSSLDSLKSVSQKAEPTGAIHTNTDLLNTKTLAPEPLTVKSVLVHPSQGESSETTKEARAGNNICNAKLSDSGYKTESAKVAPSSVVPQTVTSELPKTTIAPEKLKATEDLVKVSPTMGDPLMDMSTIRKAPTLEPRKEKSATMDPHKQELTNVDSQVPALKTNFSRLEPLKPEDAPKADELKAEKSKVIKEDKTETKPLADPSQTELLKAAPQRCKSSEVDVLPVKLPNVDDSKAEDMTVGPLNFQPSKEDVSKVEPTKIQSKAELPKVDALNAEDTRVQTLKSQSLKEGDIKEKISNAQSLKAGDLHVEDPKVQTPKEEDTKDELSKSNEIPIEPLKVQRSEAEAVKIEPPKSEEQKEDTPKVLPLSSEPLKGEPETAKETIKEPEIEPLDQELASDPLKIEKSDAEIDLAVQSKPVKSNVSKLREFKKIQKPKSAETEDNSLQPAAEVISPAIKEDPITKEESAFLEETTGIKEEVSAKLDETTTKTEPKQASILGLSFDYTPEQSTSKPQQNNRSRKTRASTVDSQDANLSDSADAAPSRSPRRTGTAPSLRSKRKLRGTDDDQAGTTEDDEVAKKKGRGRPVKGGSARKGAGSKELDNGSEQSDNADTADLGVDLVCDESSIESMPSKPRRPPPPQKAKSPKKTRKVLGLEIPVDTESPVVESGTPVRQSRRIAQIKIKEDAERREMEEATRAAIAQEEAFNKKKKHKHGSKQTSERDSSDQDNANDKDFETSKRKKKKKRKKDWNRKDFDQSNPWQSSSGSSSSMEEEDEEQEQSEEDEQLQRLTDHEFSPESDLEDDLAAQPLRRARTARKESAPPEEPADEADCQKCGKSDHPEWILLCDKCDAGWHCLCLRPALLVIPEGDWFCPPCQHTALIKSLHEQLKAFDGAAKRRENEELRKKRLAYVGISLDNVLPKTDGKEEAASGAESDGADDTKAAPGAESARSSSSSGSASDSDSEPVYQLRERRAANVSYRFNEYDDLINSAIQDEMEVAKVAGNQGRGKDIGTIIEAEREEAAAGAEGLETGKPTDPDVEFQPEPDEEEDEEEEEDGYIPPVRKSAAKKKHRKLNSLDISSDDEDGDSDEDFKGTSSEEEDEDYEEGDTDDSDVGRGRRGRGKSSGPVRRSNRSRVTRFDREFIDDDSEDSDKPARKRKPRNVWDETSESEESDSTWGRRKKQKQRTARARAPRSSEKKKKKRRKRAPGGSDNETFRASKPKKPRVSFGAPDDLETVATARRTRGQKINYVEMAGSDSDEDFVKPSKKIVESEDEFVLNEEDEELMDVEDEVKDSDNESGDLDEQFGEDSENDDIPAPTVSAIVRKEKSKKESKKKKKSEFRARMLQSDDSEDEPDETVFDDTLDQSDPVIDEEALAREERRLKKEAKKLEKKELKKLGKKKKEELEMSEPIPVTEPVVEPMESPAKRKGRGRGKAALAKAAAVEGLPVAPGAAPPAFQPAPPAQGHSVISRMLQSQPLPGPLPASGPPVGARSFTDAASAMGQKYFGDRALGERPPPSDRMSMGDRLPPGDRMALGDRIPPGDRMTMGDRMPPGDRMSMGDRLIPSDRMSMGPGDRMGMGDRMTMGERIPPGDRITMGDRMPPGDRMSMGDRMGPRGLPPSARPPFLQRGRMPLAYRQPRSPAPHFGGPRGPAGHPALYHSAHHPHDPSPSGGGPIAISPSLDKPGHGTPPPAYSRPQTASVGRFGPDGAPSPNGGVRHSFPGTPGNHMLGRAGTPPGRNPGPGNFSPYHQPTGYHYGGYPGAGPLGPDEPGSYQGTGYPEAYGSSPLATSDGSNSKPMDEEGSGEFGGLVSYFSSQREDDLDA